MDGVTRSWEEADPTPRPFPIPGPKQGTGEEDPVSVLLPVLRANPNAPLACAGAGTALGCRGDNVDRGVPRQPFASCMGQEAFRARTHAAIAIQQGMPGCRESAVSLKLRCRSEIAGERETCSFQHRALRGASCSTNLP